MEDYSIDWIHHAANLESSLRGALDRNLCSDLVLDCQSKIFRVHKVILMAASDFFVERSSEIYISIDDASPEVMSFLVEFMYFGKVQVPPENVKEFFSAGESLGIRGLTPSTMEKMKEEDHSTEVSQTRTAGITVNDENEEEPEEEIERKGIFPCSGCNKCFGSKNSLNRHSKACSHLKMLACDNCGKQFLRASSLKSHSATHNLKNKSHALLPEKTYVEKKGKNGDKAGKSKKPYTTEDRKKESRSKQPNNRISGKTNGISKHNVRVGHPEQYKCDICGKVTSKQCALVAHRIIHSDEEPFECSRCGRRFKFGMAHHRHQTACQKQQ